MKESIEQANKYIMNTYGRFPIVIENGQGCYVYDTNGKKYLDMCAGIAVNALGYGHEGLQHALKNQIDKLCHISNLYYNKPQIQVARLLVNNSNFDKVFFCNSGAEANEAALKLARKYGKQKSPYKTQIISMEKSFHGRTYGALSATGQTKYQKSFTPLVEDFKYAKYNDIQSLKDLMNENVCAVILEVIQGEGGILVGEREYLQQVQRLCNSHDVLLIVDEVQTGMGRCGKLFAHEIFKIQPDIITLAKGLGGGVPIGAMLCKSSCDILIPGDHASTFGGNPLVTAAAEVIIKELVENNLLEHIQEVGNYLKEKLKELKEKCSLICDVRGEGLMQGIELSVSPKTIINKCIEEGLLIVGAGENVIRFVPPLVIEKGQIDEAIDILERVLGA